MHLESGTGAPWLMQQERTPQCSDRLRCIVEPLRCRFPTELLLLGDMLRRVLAFLTKGVSNQVVSNHVAVETWQSDHFVFCSFSALTPRILSLSKQRRWALCAESLLAS